MVERDEKGRFTKGSSGNPAGRPRRATEERYLAVLCEAVPLTRWRKIVERAVVDAEKGDDKARRWLGDYVIGRPTEYVNTDVTSGGNALRIEWVNDWRNLTAADAAPGTENGTK